MPEKLTFDFGMIEALFREKLKICKIGFVYHENNVDVDLHSPVGLAPNRPKPNDQVSKMVRKRPKLAK